MLQAATMGPPEKTYDLSAPSRVIAPPLAPLLKADALLRVQVGYDMPKYSAGGTVDPHREDDPLSLGAPAAIQNSIPKALSSALYALKEQEGVHFLAQLNDWLDIHAAALRHLPWYHDAIKAWWSAEEFVRERVLTGLRTLGVYIGYQMEYTGYVYPADRFGKQHVEVVVCEGLLFSDV